MPYIFGKLWHLAIIWAIRKAFQCILQGVRILLAKYTRISPTSENDSYMYNQAIQEEEHFALNPLQKHTNRRTSTRCCKNTQMRTSSKCGSNLVEICSVSSEWRAAIRQSAPTTSQTLDQARVSTTGTIFVLFTLLFLQERVCYKLVNTFSEVNYNFVASRSIDGVYIH